MRDLAEVESDLIRSLRAAKSEMETAGVTATSDGNMTAEDLSRIKERLLGELKPIRRELEQMLDK